MLLVSPNLTPFHSTTSGFRVTGHFETSALNDRKKTLNPTRLNVPHTGICLTSIPESQISVRFDLPKGLVKVQTTVSPYHCFVFVFHFSFPCVFFFSLLFLFFYDLLSFSLAGTIWD